MEWTESVIETTSDGVEILTAVLIENGVSGIEIVDAYEFKLHLESSTNWDYADTGLLDCEKGKASVKFYLPADTGQEIFLLVKDAVSNLKKAEYGVDLGTLEMKTIRVDDKNWLNEWKKYYKPFRIGVSIVIKPTWEEYSPQSGDRVLNINPGHVFGTGLHQTTRLCITELEKHVKANGKIADIGCGSGILSIAALLLGAKSAVGVDLDPSAEKIVLENCGLNGLGGDRYRVLTGNVISDKNIFDELVKDKYDIVVANIIADAIILLSPLVAEFIEKNGIFIASGIITERADETLAAMLGAGFELIEKNISDEWVSITVKRLHNGA